MTVTQSVDPQLFLFTNECEMELRKYNRIKGAMGDMDMKVDELATVIGKHRNMIVAYRNNTSQPPLDVLFQIAKALKVNPCDLLVKIPDSEKWW